MHNFKMKGRLDGMHSYTSNSAINTCYLDFLFKEEIDTCGVVKVSELKKGCYN